MQRILIIMASLRLTILKDKPAKDGSFKIRVALTHNRGVKYILTRYSVDSVGQFRDGQVVKRPDAAITNRKLRSLLNDYQDALDAIGGVCQYSCKELRDLLVMRRASSQSNSTFQSVGSSYVLELIADKRENYAKLIERNNRYFSEFCNGDILFSEISTVTIANYDRFLRRVKRLGETTIGMMMSRTRTIINRAIQQQLVKYDVHPFCYYHIKSSPVRELDLSIDELRKIKDYHPRERNLRVSRDLFMLSFYFAGINLADLLAIDFRGKTSITFSRVKVRNTMQGQQLTTLPIIDEARVIIDEWMNKRTGKLDFGYKFSYANFYRYLTRCIDKMATNLKIESKVVFYSARKSFAQIAYEMGIQDGVIDYCLGHSDKGRGVIRYYTKVRREQAVFAVKSAVAKLNEE